MPSIQTVTHVAFDLADPSTYAGIGILAAMTGHVLPPDFQAVATSIATIAGVLATFLSRKHNIPMPTAPAAVSAPTVAG